MCRLRPISFDTLTARKSTNQKYYYCILLPPLLIKIHASECEQKREKRRKRQTGKHTHTLARFNISGQISNYVCAVKHTIAGRDSFLFLVLSVLFLLFLLSLSRLRIRIFAQMHSFAPTEKTEEQFTDFYWSSITIYIYIWWMCSCGICVVSARFTRS